MSGSVDTSYGGAIAVTPSDTVPQWGKALYIGGAGNVTVQLENSTTTILFTAPPVGTVIPCRFGKVMATGTTATAMVALS